MEFSRQEYWSGLPFPSPGGGGGLVTKSCPTLATCELGTYQAPRSMGFFRQEYWNGLPFPSPGDLPDPGLLHCRQILYQLNHKGNPNTQSHVWLFCDPVDYSPPGSSLHGISQTRILEWVAISFSPSPGDLPNPGSKLCLLHCRQILYHLSHQGRCALPSLHTRLLPQRWGVMKQWGGLSRLSVQDQVGPASHGHLFPCYGFLRSSATLWHRGSGARALAPLGLGGDSRGKPTSH